MKATNVKAVLNVFSSKPEAGSRIRKPHTSEVVIVASLVTLAVISRTAFFMLPQMKPVVAIVVISGACLGGGTGFFIGTMTAFVSNFIFGQGPWTIFQMIALGMAGLVAGLLIRNHDCMKKRLPLTVTGALIALAVYGMFVDI